MSDIVIVPVSNATNVVTVEQGVAVVAVDHSVAVILAMQRGPKGDAGDFTGTGGFYTKTESDNLLNTKADIVHQHVVADITDFTTAFLNGGSF